MVDSARSTRWRRRVCRRRRTNRSRAPRPGSGAGSARCSPTGGLRSETVDDALLVVEEIVANTLDHAGTPFDLDVRLADDVLHVAVRDRSVRAPRLRPYDPRAVRGRGLQMVAGLSRQWGCEEHADGKTVWAELAV